MSASLEPGGERTSYDRWTFERWSVLHARHERQVRRGRFRLLLFACVGLLVVYGCAWRYHVRPVTLNLPLVPGVPGALSGVTVILDPGHGGEDSGASAVWGHQRVQEAALTYRTALELARVLRAQGAQVQYTVRSRMLADDRDRIEPIPTLPTDAALVSTDRPLKNRVGHSPRQLWQRAGLARSVWQRDVRTDPHAAHDVFFLSLHYDADHHEGVHGSVVCVDRRAGPPPLFALALARLLTAHGWGRSTTAGEQEDLSERSLGVLDPLYNPVPQKALLEVTTLSNYDNSLAARDPAWRGQIVLAVAQAITVAHQAH
jgi:N-acetylmuramoyl-L-alanine amidase